MERINYRITLDAHKNGIQRTLQGFEIADNMSRRISVNLTASGDTYEIPFDHVTAVMYVTTPNAKEPSIEACTIEDNTVIYDMLPITEEGITEMQMKLIETRMDGAKSVLLSPKFAIEVCSSNADDGGATQTPTFTALEDALARAKSVYDARLLRIEIDDACVFRAYYADGTVYENYALHEALYNGNALLSESWAKGGTGIREGEETNNSMYFSNVSRSAAEDADMVYADARGLLNEAIRHTAFTSFLVDFENGNLEYMSSNSTFDVNKENGDLEFALSNDYDPEKLVGDVVAEYVEEQSKEIEERLQNVDANTLQGHIASYFATAAQLGKIKYKEIWVESNEYTTNIDAIKSQWETFDLDSIYLVRLTRGSQKLAIVQKYSKSHNYGTVVIYGYSSSIVEFHTLSAGTWDYREFATKSDLTKYLPLKGENLGSGDANECTTSTKITIGTPSNWSNLPTNLHGVLEVKDAGFYILQQYTTGSSDRRVYYRFFGGSSWTDWDEYSRAKDLKELGTQLGSICYKEFYEPDSSHIDVIKNKWSSLPSGILLIKVISSTTQVAWVYKHDNNYGSVRFTGYFVDREYYYLLQNGTWTIKVENARMSDLANYLPLSGGHMQGNIHPSEIDKYYLGLPNLPWVALYANNLMLVKNNVNYGHGDVSEGTSSKRGYGTFTLGNGTPDGSDGNAEGVLRLFGAYSGFTNLHPGNSGSTNHTVRLPDASGTLMRKEDFVVTSSTSGATLTINLD